MAFQISYYSRPVVDGLGFGAYWMCDDWATWHRALKKAYGKRHADWKFMECWKQQDGFFSGSLGDNCSEFNKYMKAEGIDVTRSGGVQYYEWAQESLGNIGSGLTSALKYGAYGLGALLTLWVANEALGTYKRAKSEITGFNDWSLPTKVGIGVGASGLAYAILNKSLDFTTKGTVTKTPWGLELEPNFEMFQDMNSALRSLTDAQRQNQFTRAQKIMDVVRRDPETAKRFNAYGDAKDAQGRVLRSRQLAALETYNFLYNYWDTSVIKG